MTINNYARGGLCFIAGSTISALVFACYTRSSAPVLGIEAREIVRPPPIALDVQREIPRANDSKRVEPKFDFYPRKVAEKFLKRLSDQRFSVAYKEFERDRVAEFYEDFILSAAFDPKKAAAIIEVITESRMKQYDSMALAESLDDPLLSKLLAQATDQTKQDLVAVMGEEKYRDLMRYKMTYSEREFIRASAKTLNTRLNLAGVALSTEQAVQIKNLSRTQANQEAFAVESRRLLTPNQQAHWDAIQNAATERAELELERLK